MAYVQADLDRIRLAIARGEKSVQFSDRAVTYRSLEEMLRIEAQITAALATSTTTRPKQTLLVGSKGLL